MKIYTPQALMDQVPTKALQGPAILLADLHESQTLLALVGIELSDAFPQAEKQSTH